MTKINHLRLAFSEPTTEAKKLADYRPELMVLNSRPKCYLQTVNFFWEFKRVSHKPPRLNGTLTNGDQLLSSLIGFWSASPIRRCSKPFNLASGMLPNGWVFMRLWRPYGRRGIGCENPIRPFERSTNCEFKTDSDEELEAWSVFKTLNSELLTRAEWQGFLLGTCGRQQIGKAPTQERICRFDRWCLAEHLAMVWKFRDQFPVWKQFFVFGTVADPKTMHRAPKTTTSECLPSHFLSKGNGLFWIM